MISAEGIPPLLCIVVSGVAMSAIALVGSVTLLLSEATSGMGEKYPDVNVRTRVVTGPARSALLRISRQRIPIRRRGS